MTIQLVLVAYVLTYVFENSNPFYTIALITSITTFAIFNIYKRVNIPMSKELKRVAALSMVAGSIGPLLLFIFVIIGHDPWYAPQYIVPITGMLVGNAMTGVSLGANTFLNNMKSQRGQIEGALMLGATPKEAAAPLIRDAFDSAILPTINSMVGMGIISTRHDDWSNIIRCITIHSHSISNRHHTRYFWKYCLCCHYLFTAWI